MEKIRLYQDVRSAIIKVAQEMFARYGFKKTTMDDIARALGRAKSSTYYYFKNKDELFQAVAGMEISRGKEELRKIADMRESPAKKFSAYIEDRILAVQSRASIYNFLAEEYLENYKKIEEVRTEIDREELAVIDEILKEGVRQRVFTIGDTHLTAMNILDVLKGLEYFYLKEKDVRNSRKKMKNLANILLQGLLRR
jgi:AcrR family transcriptional regulator